MTVTRRQRRKKSLTRRRRRGGVISYQSAQDMFTIHNPLASGESKNQAKLRLELKAEAKAAEAKLQKSIQLSSAIRESLANKERLSNVAERTEQFEENAHEYARMAKKLNKRVQQGFF